MKLNEARLFKNKKEWRTWLENNHATQTEIWLFHYKKKFNKKCISHFDAVEEALCFGWIDNKLKKIDDERYILRYSPRKEKSVWSKINKETAEKMISSGKMTEAGFEKINLAKKHGIWETAYTNKFKEKLPNDLKNALASDKVAWDNFKNFANSYRNMYIGWVENAKVDTTRKKRILEVVKRSRDNKKPWVE
ncbi:MAG: YdeI/OmpD-associated family protein [Candidatus Thermoplasmatota archaeon]|nr:YdeI/OmpD-associated family protein [Candidatus Thermoplasmatota archaeon]